MARGWGRSRCWQPALGRLLWPSSLLAGPGLLGASGTPRIRHWLTLGTHYSPQSPTLGPASWDAAAHGHLWHPGQAEVCTEPFPACKSTFKAISFTPAKFSNPLCACQMDPPHCCPCPFPLRGSVCPAMARSRVSLSPALNLVLGLAIKSLLTDIQMVCVSGKSQGAREMSPEHGVSPLLRVSPFPPPTPAMLYLLGPPNRSHSLVHTKLRPCTGRALM